jgi:hypothetical protein
VIGIMEYWSTGILECWNIGRLEYWNTEIPIKHENPDD